MLRIVFNPENATTTIEESLNNPEASLLHSELQKSFKIATEVLNKHQELFPGRWNRTDEAIGSAYLNLVCIIYYIRMFPRNSTLPSLEYDSQLEDSDDRKRNMSVSDMQDALMEFSKDNYSPLVNLDAYHNMLDAKDNWNDRFVFTDGTVNSINMTVTPNGNRVIVIDDLTAGFDYESENFSGTTCWVPETIPINFGIGSNVVVVGRTSQGTDEDGNARPVSINTVGLLVTSVRGSSPDDTLTDSDEDEWIF